MGAYCVRFMRRHPAKAGEVLEVRRLSSYYYDVALFGDEGEVACIPHKGCRLEIVGTAETSHSAVNLLLPGQVIRYKRSFFFGDRVELPSGTRVGFWELVGFRLQLAPHPPVPPPVEEVLVQRATCYKPEQVNVSEIPPPRGPGRMSGESANQGT